jgi:phenylacetic acid degradation operon negative regulatory protein
VADSLPSVDSQLRRRAVGAPAARSALLTVLGEFVLPRRGVWQEALVASLVALDYKPHAARRAIARSTTAGWLESSRIGRRSWLELSDETRSMLTVGAERIYGFGHPRPWDGHWLFAMLRVPEERREVRHRLRTSLAWAGFGSVGAGVWISPHVDREDEIEELARQESGADLFTFRAEIGSVGEPARLLEQAWDLTEVAAAYRAFIGRFGRSRPGTPAEVFKAQTELVHDWRRFPFLDPELPDRFLPARWPRGRAVEVFESKHAAWAGPAWHYFSELAESVGSDGSTGSSASSSRTASK